MNRQSEHTQCTRRTFLGEASLTALSAGALLQGQSAAVASDEQSMAPAKSYQPTIPTHLPRRMALCSWQFAWLTSALPNEPYGDLEYVMKGLRERGYNAIRVDAGLDLCFHADGRPRGEVEFCQAVEGYSARFRVINCRGGGRNNVLKRVIRLMELAKAYNIYVILTSWEYAHTHWFIADRSLRAEIEGVPLDQRLMKLARHHDRLLRILKERDLARHIAYVEPHNEVNYCDLPKRQEGKRLHEQAIAFLRDRHQDILIAGDMGRHLPDQVPENTQVYDHHMYAGASIYFENLFKRTVSHPGFDPKNPRKSELLDYLLEEHIVEYEEFVLHTRELGKDWTNWFWLYHNLDISRFDRWMLERYAEYEPKLKRHARDLFAETYQGAVARNLPLALEEGGFFYGPLNSRWEESEAGLSYLSFLTDLAVEHQYWVFLPTTYNGPETPIWYAHPNWLRQNNTRFLESRPLNR